MIPRINDLSSSLIFLKGQREERTARINTIEKEIARLQEDGEVLAKVLELFRAVGEAVRREIKDKIENLISSVLTTVFEEPFRFKINIVRRRNQVEVDFDVASRNMEGDILGIRGGGIADVISISLRIVLAEMLKVKGPLILDEPLRMVSEEYVPNVASFLVELSKKFGRQIICITHNKTLAAAATKQFKVRLEKGVSVVT